MERTRDEVVRLLYERGDCSAQDLADAVGVGAGSIRRHLDLMSAEGLVETRLERLPRGRPVVRYSLTEAGEEQRAAANYARLLERIYPALSNLSAEDVAGRDGAVVVDRLFAGVAEVIAREHAPVVSGDSLEQRVRQALEVLRAEGILEDAQDEGDSFRLRNVCCPYRSTAEGTHATCAADRRTIELLLGVPVEQLTTVATGGDSCEYLVRKQPLQVDLLPAQSSG